MTYTLRRVGRFMYARRELGEINASQHDENSLSSNGNPYHLRICAATDRLGEAGVRPCLLLLGRQVQGDHVIGDVGRGKRLVAAEEDFPSALRLHPTEVPCLVFRWRAGGSAEGNVPRQVASQAVGDEAGYETVSLSAVLVLLVHGDLVLARRGEFGRLRQQTPEEEELIVVGQQSPVNVVGRDVVGGTAARFEQCT